MSDKFEMDVRIFQDFQDLQRNSFEKNALRQNGNGTIPYAI